MRIRSTLAGLALGAGVLVLSSPVALADTNAQPPTSTASPTRTTTRPAPPTTAPTSSRVPLISEPTRTTAPGPQVVKPKGAAETGGGMEDTSTNTGMFVIGGVALAGLAGGGLAFRRLRKQN